MSCSFIIITTTLLITKTYLFFSHRRYNPGFNSTPQLCRWFQTSAFEFCVDLQLISVDCRPQHIVLLLVVECVNKSTGRRKVVITRLLMESSSTIISGRRWALRCWRVTMYVVVDNCIAATRSSSIIHLRLLFSSFDFKNKLPLLLWSQSLAQYSWVATLEYKFHRNNLLTPRWVTVWLFFRPQQQPSFIHNGQNRPTHSPFPTDSNICYRYFRNSDPALRTTGEGGYRYFFSRRYNLLLALGEWLLHPQ